MQHNVNLVGRAIVCFCVLFASVPLFYTQETSVNVCGLRDHKVWTLKAGQITKVLRSLRLRPEVGRE